MVTSTASLLQSIIAHALACHVAFFFGPAVQMIDAAERTLRTVFGGGDVADVFAIDTDVGDLWTDMTIRVDLHLNTAIAEDAFRDDRDGVHPVIVARDDERGGFVVRIGGAGADFRDENVFAGDQVAVPVAFVAEERHHFTAFCCVRAAKTERPFGISLPSSLA